MNVFSGLLSGLGAALADLIYGIVATFCLNGDGLILRWHVKETHKNEEVAYRYQ